MILSCHKKYYQSKNGKNNTYKCLKYSCANRRSGKICDGQWFYSVRIVDEHLIGVINNFLLSENIEYILAYRKDPTPVIEQIEALELSLIREKQSLEELKKEVIEVIRGTSAFGSVLLSDLIHRSESKIIEIENEILLLRGVDRKQKIQLSRLLDICGKLGDKNIKSFASLTLLEQQSVVKQIINRIYVGSGGKYRIEWAYGGCLQEGMN